MFRRTTVRAHATGVRVDGVEFVTEVQDCGILIDGDPEQPE
ncbi:hypothetical protein [Streptomyces sp. c-19]